LPPPEIELRLYGCVVGKIELPPWARLIASGCIFDAASVNDAAIIAPASRVELRHCTIRGTTQAGELRASSCVFSGAVQTGRADLGFIRHSVLRYANGNMPRLYRCIDHTPSFLSLRPTEPNYLVLADNNGPAVLATGEEGRLPGAHEDRTDRTRELYLRTEQQMPIGLVPVHQDRVVTDLARMSRRIP
jgi:hypothetical protein